VKTEKDRLARAGNGQNGTEGLGGGRFGRAPRRLIQIRADVFANARFDFDVEAGMGRNIKKLACRVADELRCAVELDFTFASDQFHPFGFPRAEMEFARINQTESLFAAIGKNNGVADDFAIEINVGLCDGGDAGKLRRYICHKRVASVGKPEPKSIGIRLQTFRINSAILGGNRPFSPAFCISRAKNLLAAQLKKQLNACPPLDELLGAKA
jgi:hypothetical protein